MLLCLLKLIYERLLQAKIGRLKRVFGQVHFKNHLYELLILPSLDFINEFLLLGWFQVLSLRLLLLSDEHSQLFLQCIYIPLSLVSAPLYSVDLLGYFLNVNLKFIVRGYRLLVLGLPDSTFGLSPFRGIA